METTGIFVNARFLTQPITGVQRFAIEILKQLKNLIPDIKFISPREIIHEDLANDLNVIICGKYKGHIWEQIELPIFLKGNGAVVLINLANTAPILFKRNIVTVHDLAYKVNPKWFSKAFYYYYNWLIPKIVKKAFHVFTVSEFSKLEISKLLHVPIDKISVAYNAVSNYFQYEPNENSFSKDIPEEYILSVGSVDPRKNLLCLIEAFQRLPNEKMKLCLVGRKHKVFADNKLISLIDQNPNIVFFENVTDHQLAILYQKAKAFVYPSLYEGFGIPNLEALAMSCPVITSDIAVFKEVCPEAAWYFNPNNSSQLSKLIVKLMNEPEAQQQLKKLGVIRVKQFSWSSSAKLYKEVILKFSQIV